MKTFSITTLGCKVNQYETRQIAQVLEKQGLTWTDPARNPDILIVNTCCVTKTASAKSRQAVNKLNRISPDTSVFVTGCLAKKESPDDELKNLPENAKIIYDKNKLAQALTQMLKKNKNHTPPAQLPDLCRYKNQSRAFLKVQDGCDGYCSYCIIPKIRTNITSKPIERVINEAQNLIKAGHPEIVLTGIFLGAYGQSTVRRKNWNTKQNLALPNLVNKIAQLPNLKRLRLSSLEPGDVTDTLLQCFKNHKNIAPHLHLPLQTGSPAILKKMARQYTIPQYLNVIEKIKNSLDSPAITTDIITGFPGESEKDFQNTIEIAQKVKFAKIHVFSFSPRKNTPAAEMKNQIPPETIKQRSKILSDLDKKLQLQFRKKFIGKSLQVIVEKIHKTGSAQGRCQQYFMVKIPKAMNPKKNQIINITLKS